MNVSENTTEVRGTPGFGARGDLASTVEGIIAPSVTGMGYELVRIQLSGGHRQVLQIMAERVDRQPMTVDDCADISRTVSAVLDVADPIAGAYTLEVSSPGIDRPLTRLADYDRFAGHVARVELRAPQDGRKRFQGTLQGTHGETVRVETPEGLADLPFSAILRARLILTDALIAANP